MKPASLLPALLTLAIFSAALPVSSPAADVYQNCSPESPLDAPAVLRQIELKVAKAQYEKVLLAIYDAQLTLQESAIAATTEEQKKADLREALKVKILEGQRAELRALIEELVSVTNRANEERESRGRSKDHESK